MTLPECNSMKLRESIAQLSLEIAEAKATRVAMDSVQTAPRVKGQATREIKIKVSELKRLESTLKAIEDGHALQGISNAARQASIGKKRKQSMDSESDSDLTSVASDPASDVKRPKLTDEEGRSEVEMGADSLPTTKPMAEKYRGSTGGGTLVSAVGKGEVGIQDGVYDVESGGSRSDGEASKKPTGERGTVPVAAQGVNAVAPGEAPGAGATAALGDAQGCVNGASVSAPSIALGGQEAERVTVIETEGGPSSSAVIPTLKICSQEAKGVAAMAVEGGPSGGGALVGTAMAAEGGPSDGVVGTATPIFKMGQDEGLKPTKTVGKVSARDFIKQQERERKAAEREAMRKAKELENEARAEKAKAVVVAKLESGLLHRISEDSGFAEGSSNVPQEQGTEKKGRSQVPANSLDMMSPEDYKKEEEAAWKEVKAFLQDPDHVEISGTTRKRIREHPNFIPQGATISRALSIHILTTTRGKNKLWCLYHHMLGRGARQARGVNKKNFLITGMPGEDVRDSGVTTPGCMDCGCLLEDGLWNFVFWKTWKLTTKRGGEVFSEGWAGQHLDPRSRSLVVAAFKSASKLELTDIYTGLEMDYMGFEHQVRLCTAVNHTNNKDVIQALNVLGVPESSRLKYLYQGGWEWLGFAMDVYDRGVTVDGTLPDENSGLKILTARPILLKTTLNTP